MNLWNKSVQARQVILPSLVLGPVHVESCPCLDAKTSRFLQNALGFKVDAIVGLDVLRQSSFMINYRSKGNPVWHPRNSDLLRAVRDRYSRRHRSHGISKSTAAHGGGFGRSGSMLFRSRVSEPTGLQALGTETVADAGGTFQRTKVRISELYIRQRDSGAANGIYGG